MSTKKSSFNSIFSCFCPIRVYIESYHRFHFRTVFLTQANDYFCVTWIMNTHGTAQHITQHIIRMLKKCRCVSHEYYQLVFDFVVAEDICATRSTEVRHQFFFYVCILFAINQTKHNRFWHIHGNSSRRNFEKRNGSFIRSADWSGEKTAVEGLLDGVEKIE